jgi:uncharacterized protein (TIRG00374 family)
MRDIIKGFLGILSATIIIGLLVYFIGIEEFTNALLSANPYYAIASLICAVLWLLMWSTSFYVVNLYLDLNLSYVKSFLTYASIMFTNHITPFAHLGGEPLAAGIIARSIDKDYDHCLGVISTVSVIHFIPSILFFTFGLIYMSTINGGIPTNINNLILGFIIIGMVLVGLGVLLFRYQDKFEDISSFILKYIIDILSYIPRIPKITRKSIKNKINGYLSSFRKVSKSPKTILIATFFSTLGLGFQALGLWIALHSVGANVSIVIPMIAFPIAGLASILPLPGGVGGIEAILITIVSTLSSVGLVDITTAVILIRGGIYWTPIIIGSIHTGILAKDIS